MPQPMRVTGIIVAGGASRRMGRDKRLLPIHGEPMLRRVARTLATVTDEVVVSVSRDNPLPNGALGGLDARIVTDRLRSAGPLAGLEAGLAAARHELAVAVAADMPSLVPELLRRMVERLAETDADAVAVATERGPQPLLATYRCRAALRAASALLNAGERRMGALLEALRVETFEDDGASALNVNGPADLAEAAR